MSTAPRTRRTPWRARALLALDLVALTALLGLLLRLVLLTQQPLTAGASATLGLFVVGGLRDALMAPFLLWPLLLVLAFARLRTLRRRRWTARILVAGVGALATFLALVEYRFFEEFDARFNNIAVDYLLYPGEVAGNLWESYNVPLHVLGALACGALAAGVLAPRLARRVYRVDALRPRLAATGLVLVATPACAFLAFVLPRTLWEDRRANELAANGPLEFVRTLWTADLAYPLYYRTLEENEARRRAAQVLGFPAPSADAATFELQRKRPAQPVRAPQQIVVLLEESLGSDFVGELTPENTDCTPALERHFADGLLLTNLIANGNRTVRGLEGVLCSFVPLPGYAILRRGKSDNIATVARVLRERGYPTLFVYGGEGTFDHMESFLTQNGWDEFVTEGDYPADAFRTAWGVADQYEFDALLARQEQAHARGEKLFATLLSVSNHKPYDVPQDRFPLPAGLSGRRAAVRYADACIGAYLDALRTRGLAEETLVLVVGDHGARVYGSETIPTESYRIPALFVTPDPRWKGQRIERLCSQIDLVPTLLDLAGIAYEAPFFGTSLLGLPREGGRAFVQHNRDVGLMTDEALVVLGLQRSVLRYVREAPGAHTFRRATEADHAFDWQTLEDDASAVFQSAYELYATGAYRLPAKGDASEPGGVGTF